LRAREQQGRAVNSLSKNKPAVDLVLGVGKQPHLVADCIESVLGDLPPHDLPVVA